MHRRRTTVLWCDVMCCNRVSCVALRYATLRCATTPPYHTQPDCITSRYNFASRRVLATPRPAISHGRNIAGHIADNQVERDVNEVERRILKAGPDGILKGKLKDQVRAIRKREFDDIVASLEESGRIAIERTSSATKPGFRLTHCSFGGEG